MRAIALLATWALFAASAPAPDARAVLVAYAPGGEGSVLDALAALGATVHGHWSPGAYLASVPADATLGGVTVSPWAAEHKTRAALAPGDELLALLFPASDPAHVVERLAGVLTPRVVVPGAREHLLLARLDGDPTRLLADPAVWWVERWEGAALLDNANASGIVQSGARDAWPFHARGVNGSSQRVAYCDTGLDTDAPLGRAAGFAVHELFRDPLTPIVHALPEPLHRKVPFYYSPVEGGMRGDADDAVGHGSHVGGTLAGDAGAWGARDGDDGVAFAARLVVCDASIGVEFQVLADYANYWEPAYLAGARVHSNSWGTVGDGTYGIRARQHDAYAYDHPDLLILRSAGNGASQRAEAAAKDILAIGATREPPDAEASVADFSARGPASDGRVKPDLVLPGDCVRSADLPTATSYFCASGTSQATAVAAGAATLVRDFLAKGYHPSDVPDPDDALDPSAALVRAILVASARSIASPAPDAAQGWGRPVLDDALGLNATLALFDAPAPLAAGQAWEAEVAIPSGALRVVLAWTDPPALPGASVALVNDLDLVVRAPDGTTYRGNALGTGASTPNATARDATNVVELVHVANASGAYRVRVEGASVPMGPQGFALVALAR